MKSKVFNNNQSNGLIKNYADSKKEFVFEKYNINFKEYSYSITNNLLFTSFFFDVE